MKDIEICPRCESMLIARGSFRNNVKEVFRILVCKCGYLVFV